MFGSSRGLSPSTWQMVELERLMMTFLGMAR